MTAAAAPRRVRGPRSLAGRVTLAAVVAVGLALAVGGTGVVVAAGQADRRALDRELRSLIERLDGPSVRGLRPGADAGGPPGAVTPPGVTVQQDDGSSASGDAAAPSGDGSSASGDGGSSTYGDGGSSSAPDADGDGRPGDRGPGGRGPGDHRGRGGPGGVPPLDPGSDRFARVVLPTGIAISQGTPVPARFPVPEASDKPKTVEAGGEDWRTITRQLQSGRTLQVAARLEPLQDDARRLMVVVLAALLGALLLTALLTRGLARIALGPLERLRGTAEDVASTADLTKRVAVGDGPEEVDALAGDLNAMLARLGVAAEGQRRALESARRFAADAGHELRTPLTSLEANLATGAVDPARADARRLTALVEQLQALARGEAGPPARPERVDLADLADAAIVDLRRRHPSVTAELDAPAQGPWVLGEPESLRMLLDNLLENAARHGRRAGRVRVRLLTSGGDDGEHLRPRESGGDGGEHLRPRESGSDGGEHPRPGGESLADVVVLVDDDGPGIPQAERERVLGRFARGAGARGEGTGLGLAIAAAQAARHGGGLRLEESDLGGLRAHVTLRTDDTPASRPA